MIEDLDEIRNIRKRLGLTQSNLAERAGVSQSLIAKIENDRAVPSYENGKKIMSALDDALEEFAERKKASDVHSTELYHLKPSDTVGLALKVMKENAISQLPVVSEGFSVGSVTEEGLIKNFERLDREREIYSVMDESFPMIDQGANLKVVKELLHHYPSVLTLKEGAIVGIITKSDLLGEI
ncbi:MAG: CBS domain-containing protein [Thermoplasmatota archaeon]